MDYKKIVFITLAISFVSYSFFVYTKGTEISSEISSTPQITKGKLLWQKHNCIACHQIFGLGGYLGPELTTVISQKGKGPDYAKAFIKTGTVAMPNFHLNDDEVQCLVEYLQYIDTVASNYKIQRN